MEETSFLNPRQTPVMACDQPLLVFAKQIQWEWPEIYGEDRFVVMFGGLHIEIIKSVSIALLLTTCSSLLTTLVASVFMDTIWCAKKTKRFFVVMFGGLHIEMAACKLLGDLLKGTGWGTALSEADIASLGTCFIVATE
jgi:hypothetical protein